MAQVPPHTGHPRRWAVLSVLVVSLVVVILDNTVLNVALRVIADPHRGLGATQSQLEWAVNAYTLVFAGLLFTWGVVGDRWGRKKSLLLGLALFGLASLASGYAQDPAQLIAARAAMGVGGAAVMPATLSIISNVFDPRERARAIGIWAGAVGLGVAVGPIVGGLLLEHFWWGSVFMINVPVVLAGIVAVGLIVPESRDPRPGRVDVAGVLLSIAGLVALVYGIIQIGDEGFRAPTAWGPLFASVAILIGFVVLERRLTFPSLDVRLFRNPRFSAAVGATGLVFLAAMGTFFFLAFYLQLVRGYTPLEAGLVSTPFALAQLVFAPSSAAMVRRFGPKAVCAAGTALLTISLAALIAVGVDTPIWVVCAVFFIQGVGMANVIPPSTESIMASVPREKAGVGSAVGNTIRQVGGALGVAILGSVVSAVYRNQIAEHLTGLPPAARGTAGSSISGAYAVANGGGTAGTGNPGALLHASNDAFLTGMHTAAFVAAAVGVVGLVIVLAWLPSHSAVHPHVTESVDPSRELELAEA
ncbi:MAG: MFS transporter [Micromonosporaceae bacterium]|nr:MFS transporter [Micromonosporaceae bacterium]